MRMDLSLRHTSTATVLLVLVAGIRAAAAQSQDPPQTAPGDDPVLAGLIRDSVASRPELAAIEARTRAARERVAQAEAFPDPTLSLGIQNDGFDRIAIGEMETSFISIMLSQ